MAQRKVTFVPGEFYHLYNRGNSKQEIFLDDEDRDRFIKLLYLCNSAKSFIFRDDIIQKKIDAWDFEKGDPIVSIGAWVLMPNHFHLLVTIPIKTVQIPGIWEKESQISYFMRKVCLAYSKYFNKKYARTGGLFETNFKSTYVNSDEYLKYLFSYIHLNPIKLIDPDWKENGITDIPAARYFLGDYVWSSYHEYLGTKRVQEKILSKKDFPKYFTTKEVFEEEIFDWLSFASHTPGIWEGGAVLEN